MPTATILSSWRTSGVRPDGSNTAPDDHMSLSDASAALRGLRASGLVPQLWRWCDRTSTWIPARI